MAIPKLRVEMLGLLRARAGRAVISHFRTKKSAALFSYLAYHCDRSHPRDQLVEMLWPDARAQVGRNRLSKALWSMRHELARSGADVDLILEADHSSVHLHARTDVHDFEAAVRENGARAHRISSLAKAQEIYRGELLPGEDDEWILSERRRLRDLFVRSTHELVSLLRHQGEVRSAVAVAQRGLDEDPLSEAALWDLMQTHLDAQEPQLALRAYHEVEERLKADGQQRPSAQTRELAQRIVIVSRSSDGAVDAPRTHSGGPATTKTSLLAQFGGGRWAQKAWSATLARLEPEIARGRGQVLREEPGSVLAGFTHPVDALDCAMRLRELLHGLPRSAGELLDVRLALDTFMLEPRHGGIAAGDEVQRLAQRARLGEIVLSEATAALVRSELAPGVRLQESRGTASERFYRVVFASEGEAPLVLKVNGT